MSRLRELMKELCLDGVEYKKLGEIAINVFRGSGIKRDEVREKGIPCVRYGEIYTTYGIWFDTCISHTDETAVANPKYFEHGDILFAITGENVEEIAKSTAYIGYDRCLAGGDIVVLQHRQNPKYLSYVLSTEMAQRQKSKGRVKSKVVHSSVPAIKGIEIPVPPLEIQNEIVKLLDNFTELTAELTAELTLRKKQYNFYRDSLLNFVRVDDTIVQTDRQTDRQAQRISKFGRRIQKDVVWRTLGDIGTVCMCKRILKQQTNTESGIPFYKIGTFGKAAESYISEELFEEYKAKYSYPRKGEILISAAGTIGRTVIYDGAPAYFQDSNIVWIANDESVVLNRYLYYFYSLFPWSVAEGGTVARLYNDQIRRTEIPIPPLEVQQKIVSILDRFDALCNDLTSGLPAEIAARKKQYEHYRDKLLTFPRSNG